MKPDNIPKITESILKDRFEKIVRGRREYLNLNQKQFAKKLNKAPSTYNEIEKNLHKSTLKTFCNICNELDLIIQIIPKENLQ